MINTIISKNPDQISNYIYKEIEKDLKAHKKAILLVPEQYTLESDINFIENIGFDAVMDAKVLSFSSLKSMIFRKIGLEEKDFLSKQGKIMVITSLLQDLNDELALFKNKASNIDFVNSISDLIGSFKDNNFNQEFFAMVEESEDDLTKIKFRELKLILDAYEQAIGDKFVDNEDSLAFLSENIKACDFLKDVNFYFDKFDSLSDLKAGFVGALLDNKNKITFGITLDGSFLKNPSLSDKEYFDSSIRLYNKLRSLDTCKDIFLEDKEVESDLGHLAHNFESYNPQKYKGEIDNIRFIEAPSTVDEVESLAIIINVLIKKYGLRYKDIGVYISDEEEFQNELSKIFNRYDFPYFMDRERKLSDNHIIKTFTAILRLALYKFNEDDLSFVLRSNIFTFGEDFEARAINFDNFIRNRKIKGEMVFDDKYFEMDEDFYRNIYKDDPRGQKKFEEKVKEYEDIRTIRARLLDLLAPILDIGDAPAREIVGKIYEVIDNEAIKSGISSYQNILQEIGDLDDFKENDQVWDKFIGILEEINKIIGDRKTSLSRIYDLIASTLKDISIGIIPPSKDHVTVTSLSRSRISKRKVNFVLGLNDVFFPKGSKNNLIIGEDNLDSIRKLGLDLKVFDEDLEEREKLSLYRLITMSEKLFLSFSLANKDGEKINKSMVLTAIMKIFGDDKARVADYAMIYPNKLKYSSIKYSFSKVQEYALNIIRDISQNIEVSPKEKDLAKAFLSYLEAKERAELIKKALVYTNDKKNLSVDNRNSLYNKNHFNISEIETYSRCPYRYFISYGIRPNIEEPYEIESLEVGNIVHKLMEDISIQISKGDIKDLSKEEFEELLLEKFKKATSENLDKTRISSSRNKFVLENVYDSTKNNAQKLIDQMKNSDFKIYAVEEDFGYDDSSRLDKVFVDDINYLRGRIDRIDRDKEYVRVIDYKTGNKEFKIVNLLNGIDLQLLIYMMAIGDKKEEMIPIGAFYMPLADELVSLKEAYNQESIEDNKANKFKMSGIIVDIDGASKLLDKNADDLENSTIIDGKKSAELTEREVRLLENFAKRTISNFIREIKGGSIKIVPLAYDQNSNECQYCSYRGICKIDYTIDQLRYRIFDKDKSIDGLEGEDNDGIY